MKKLYKTAALVISSALLLGSCSESSVTAGQDALINAVVSDAASPKTAKTAEAAAAPTPASSAGQDTSTAQSVEETDAADVDIDLTAMNSTMIYSVIYDMMINADSYYGKTLLVDGYFDSVVYDDTDTRYYFVVVPDATACCVQGLEFKLDDTKLYPQDYPGLTEDIRVKGVMDCYEEDGQLYSYIRAEKLEIKNS